MIGSSKRNNWAVIALIVFAALTVLAAGCGSGEETTTSSATSTTAASTADSSNATTVVSGGKTLEQYQAQIPELEKAIAADPADLYSLESLAVANYQLGNYEAAEAAYLKILAITDDAFTRNNLGNVYRDWGKNDQAIATYKAAIATDPTLKYAYVNLAGIYKAQGDIQAAVDVLESGLKHVKEADTGTLQGFQDDLTSTTTTT